MNFYLIGSNFKQLTTLKIAREKVSTKFLRKSAINTILKCFAVDDSLLFA